MIITVRANGATETTVITTPPTIASFRASHGAAYGVNSQTQIRVNNTNVPDSYVLKEGDHVEFYQGTSQKAAYRIQVSANGSTQTYNLDSAKTGDMLRQDAGIRASLGVSASATVTVNGGSKSNSSPLVDGDTVEFTQATSQKAA